MTTTSTSTPSLPFFFNDTATTEIYTLSLHDALPILSPFGMKNEPFPVSIKCEDFAVVDAKRREHAPTVEQRSEEHTSELQSRLHLVCRLLLEKKKLKSPLHPICRLYLV